MHDFFIASWILFYASILLISLIFIVRGARSTTKRTKVFTVTFASITLATCAYFLPLLFAITAGTALGLMAGKPISVYLAYVLTSAVAILICSLACLVTQLGTRFIAVKIAT
jgi:hypothetical protein